MAPPVSIKMLIILASVNLAIKEGIVSKVSQPLNYNYALVAIFKK